MAPTNIALITCSTREPRINPFITGYAHEVLDSHIKTTKWTVKVSIIDIADQNLPLYNEPAIPSHLPRSDPTPHYVQAHTCEWSRLIQQYDAFIFVTPQYNWSIPASLKNALDYLFHEWAGKPAGIVTYGGRGGGKAGDHLQSILTGLRMRPAKCIPRIVVQSTAMEDWAGEGCVSKEDREAWKVGGVDSQLQLMFTEILDEKV